MKFQLFVSFVLVGLVLASAQNQMSNKEKHGIAHLGYAKNNMNNGYAKHNYEQMLKQQTYKHDQNDYNHGQGQQQHLNQYELALKYYGYNHGQDPENYWPDHGQGFTYSGRNHGQGLDKNVNIQVQRFEKSIYNKGRDIQQNTNHYGYQQPTPEGNAKVYVYVRQVFQAPTETSYQKQVPYTVKNQFPVKQSQSAQVFQSNSLRVGKQKPNLAQAKTPVPVKIPTKVSYSAKVEKSYPMHFTRNVPYNVHQLDDAAKKVPVFVKEQYNDQGYGFRQQHNHVYGQQFNEGYGKQYNDGFGQDYATDFEQLHGTSYGQKYGNGYDNENGSSYDNYNDDQYNNIFKQFFQQQSSILFS